MVDDIGRREREQVYIRPLAMRVWAVAPPSGPNLFVQQPHFLRPISPWSRPMTSRFLAQVIGEFAAGGDVLEA